ncbi:MAG: RNA polymerase sporulation sigma factor SigH [Hespellia sp.]|nr:RNA polymerase sporulation sigma factor SigH [Hespellia sp.]
MSKYETMTDEHLIEALRAGDTDVTDYIMDKYKSLVRKKARALFLFGGENDDLIQEGMIGLFKAVRNFDAQQGASFHSFAELCIVRQMYSAIEASKRKKHLPLNSYVSLYEETENGESEHPPLLDILQPDIENDPEAIFFGKEYTNVFERELKKSLSPLENKVLYLHLMGTNYRTIATLIGKSSKTVDNALQRIKSKAEKLLSKENN